MQAILTKYFGPGNVRGSRVHASAEAGSVTMEWEPALSAEDNHVAAAKALCAKFNWSGAWVMGETREHYVFVCVENGRYPIEPAFTVEREESCR
jgi:hypothetical protein